MDIIHELQRAPAAQIRARMVDAPSYSAVRSTLRILVEKGQLKTESDGTRYIYSATVSASVARRSALQHVVRTFFGGSVEGAVSTLLEFEDGNLSGEEKARIQALIDRATEEGR